MPKPGFPVPILVRRRLPATAEGAEVCLLILFLGQRCLAVAQLGAALLRGLGSMRHRGALDAGLANLFMLESAVVAFLAVRRRAYRSTRLALVDVATSVLLLLAETVTVPLTARYTSWAGWAYPVSLGAAAGAAIALPRLWHVVASVACLVAAYLAVTLVPATKNEQVTTAVTDALSYIGFAAVLRGISGYLRRLARAADTARGEAAWLAAYVERSRHRQLLHDQASVLALLSEPVQEPLASSLRQQAAAGAAKIRWFLTEEDPVPGDNPVPSDGRQPAASLREQVLATCSTFSDLPMVVTVDLVLDDPPPAVTVALVDALATLLHNVRRHANAAEVVVHVESEGGRWELVVRDQGVGFDPLVTPRGYGLQEQVVTPIRALGGQVSITSEPGNGTTVRVWGA